MIARGCLLIASPVTPSLRPSSPDASPPHPLPRPSRIRQIPSFSGSLPMQIATVITVILTIWRTVLPAYLLPADGRYCHVCYGGQTVSSTLSAAANLVFTFGSHAMMPEEVREMRRSLIASDCC